MDDILLKTKFPVFHFSTIQGKRQSLKYSLYFHQVVEFSRCLISVHPQMRFFVQDQASGLRAYAPKGHAKKITTGIYLIFRGLFFEHNAEIGQKGHLWMGTNFCHIT